MNEDTVRHWFTRAENDLKAGTDEFATERPATDTVCFHMQQCAEKYLKGFLIFHGKEIEKTHNLTVILTQCLAVDASFQELLDKEVDQLTPYATVLRYPDDFYMPDAKETENAIHLAECTRRYVRDKLPSLKFNSPGQ